VSSHFRIFFWSCLCYDMAISFL